MVVLNVAGNEVDSLLLTSVSDRKLKFAHARNRNGFRERAVKQDGRLDEASKKNILNLC